MRLLRSCAVLAGFVVFALACGGVITTNDSCGPFVDAINAMFQQCGVPSPDNAGARAAFVAYCNALASAPGAADVGAQYAACTKNLDAKICGGPQCSLRGKLASNAPCTDGAQCQSGLCVPTGSAGPATEQTCGTCAALGEQGAICSTPNVVCDTNLVCNNQTCEPLPGCGNGGPCTGESYCDGQACQPLPSKGQACTTRCLAAYACIGGVCSDRVAPGGPCPTGQECQIFDFCNPVTHVCSNRVGAGVSCGVPDAYNACADGLFCTNGSHVCVAPAPLGASCGVGNGECATGLWCANGTCQVPDFTLCK